MTTVWADTWDTNRMPRTPVVSHVPNPESHRPVQNSRRTPSAAPSMVVGTILWRSGAYMTVAYSVARAPVRSLARMTDDVPSLPPTTCT